MSPEARERGGRSDKSRSALHSLHSLDVRVVTARAQDELDVGSAPVAPVPAVVARECRFQHAFIGRNPTAFFVADRFARCISVRVEVHLSTFDHPRILGFGTLDHLQLDLSALSRRQGAGTSSRQSILGAAAATGAGAGAGVEGWAAPAVAMPTAPSACAGDAGTAAASAAASAASCCLISPISVMRKTRPMSVGSTPYSAGSTTATRRTIAATAARMLVWWLGELLELGLKARLLRI